MFTERDILEMCSNKSVFLSGRQYFENGRIKKLEKDRTNSDEIYIYAKVRGTHTYNVTVWLEGGRVAHKLCDCAAFHKYTGICKHIAAVLLSCVEKSADSASGESVSTDPEMSRIIREYTNRENAASLDMERAEKMTVVPHMAQTSTGEVKVDFRVGAARKYVVKDVRRFVGCIRDCEYFEYGKNFGFLHTPGAFDGKSRRMLSVIENAVRENEIFNSTYNKYSYMSALTTRELTLTPSTLDLFIEVCMGGRLSFTSKKGVNAELEIVDGNPDLEIVLEKYGGEGAVLRLGALSLLCGREHCYVVSEDKLYRCDGKYSEAMSGLLRAAASAGGRALAISRGDMVYFCNNVLPRISEFVQVLTEGINLEQYSMPDASVKFFVDNPRRGVVTCRTECTYGDVRVDIFADSAERREYRNRGMENNIKMCLMRYFRFSDSGLMELRDDDDALFRLADTGFDELRRFGEVYISEQFERLRIAPAPRFSVGVSLSGGLLDFELDSDELSFRELSKILKSYKQRKKYHRLPDGSFLKLENNALAAVSDVVGNISDDGEVGEGNVITVPQYRALYVDSVLKGDIDVKRDVNFKALIRSIKSVEDSDFAIPASLRKILRNFQRKGFRWLKTLDSYGLSGILADEMGLGKTLQIISLFLSAKEEGDGGCSLIVCPASLVYNWESEFAAFAPSVKTCVVAGSLEERTRLIAEHDSYDVLITSYDLLKRDVDLYKDVKFRFEVIDEAQYIKNYSTQSARSVKEIKARSRFALTGTPIENRLSELWSIFDFLMPGFLYDYRRFRNEFEIPVVKDKDETALANMKRMIAPFILRRLKADVLHELPEKLENVVISKMEPEQEKLYLAHVKQLKESLAKTGGSSLGRDAVKVLSELTRLRQICCDPALIYENYSGGSAKLETCMNIVRETLDNGHKVLIFSQFTSMLEIFERRLREEKIDFYTLTGATGKEKRMSLVTGFQTGRVPVFLISLKAGGTGLNLTAADVVIHYDPWWNVAAQNQATDRAHRIGQKHVVTVYKFITKGSIEENILKLQDRKRDLADSIIADSGAYSGSLSRDDILAILEGC